MYSRLNDLCHYERHHPETIISNRHFLKPNNSIYHEIEVVVKPRQDFLPNFWGPDAWRFLDTVAKGYSNFPTYSEKLQMRRFLESLTSCLPCGECRNNFCKEVVLIEDGDLGSPESVEKWLKKLRRKIALKKNRNASLDNNRHHQKSKKEEFIGSDCMACGGH